MKCTIISDDCGEPYLIRLTLFELFGFSLKLHTIIRSDRERELHDHPWSFFSFILTGGYYEETPVNPETYQFGHLTEKTWIGPWSFRFCRAPHPHRLDLRTEFEKLGFDPLSKSSTRPIAEGPEIPCVTLVFMLPKFREWGFYSKVGWLHWKKYVNNREC